MVVERSQKREVLVGGALLGVLFLLFFGIFFLADVRRLFTKTDKLLVLMPTAAGLKSGSLVWIAGETVGEVKEILVRPPDSDSLERVLLKIEVEERHLEHIRRDSEARVTSFRVIGDPVLDITPGTRTAPPIKEGDTLRIRTTGTPAAVIARARSLKAELELLLTDTRTLAGQAKQRKQQAARMGQQLAVIMREFQEFTFAVQEGPLNTFSDPEFKRTLTSLSKTIGDLKTSFTRAGERASRARADAGPAFQRLSARADTIQQEIARLQASIAQSGGGLLIRAQTDTAIVKGLHRAQTQLDSLIAETKRNPLRFWF